MLSRALSLAAVMLLIEYLAAVPAQAQNLEAGKSPSQIFAGVCAACHKSPRGLLKTVPAGSLPGFLRQHYTTSSDMASVLSAFLISNGAADTRNAGGAQPGREARQDGRQRGGASQEAARPDPEGAKPNAGGLQTELGHVGRNAKRLVRPGEGPDAAKPAEAQAPIANERGPDGPKSAKQRLSKRGKPPAGDSGEAAKRELLKPESGKAESSAEDAAKGASITEDESKSNAAKPATGNPNDAKAPAEGKSEAAKIEPERESPGGDTPAPLPSEASVPPASSITAPARREESTPSVPPAAPPTPAIAASVPPLPPVAPAGPPAPPISQ